MKYNAVIFDLDGTTLATLDDLAISVNTALRKNNLPQRSFEEIRQFVGNGIRNLIERSVPDNTDKSVTDRVHKDFTEYYKEHCTDNTRPYDGIPEMLEKLKKRGIKLAVLSNKADYAVQELCEKYFKGCFDAVAGEILGIPKKPAPDGVYAILKKMGAELKSTVYVGDSEVDIITAKNSDMDCVAVDWGFRDRQVLVDSGAKVIVSDPEELYKAITD